MSTLLANSQAGNRAFLGMVWAFGAVFFGKLASLASQWVLGLYLLPEDYGTIAQVLVAQGVVSVLADFGIGRMLIQEGKHFEENAGRYMAMALSINFFAILSLVCLWFWAFRQDSHSLEILGLLSFVAIAIPLGTVAQIYKSKASISLSFSALGKVDLLGAIFQNMGVIVLAVYGLGAYSVLVPLTFLAGWQLLGYKFVSTWRIPRGVRFGLSEFKCFVYKIRWLMAGSVGMSLLVKGDYFALSFELVKEDLGFYYFGFQLIASISVLFSTGVQSVLMPTFSALSGDRFRAANSFLKASALMVLFSGLFVALLISVLPDVMNVLWGDRWERSKFVAIIIGVSVPLKLVSPVGISILESLGLWRNRTLIIIIDGLFLTFSAYLGAVHFGMEGAAIAVAVERVTVGLISYFYAGHVLKIELSQIFRNVIPRIIPYIGTLFVLIVFCYFNNASLMEGLGIAFGAAKVAVVVVTWLMFSLIFCRNDLWVVLDNFGYGERFRLIKTRVD